MKICDLLNSRTIKLNLQATDKESVIEELIDILIKAKKLDKRNKARVKRAILARESLGSTGIGQSVAIPHAKDECIKKMVACCGLSQKGVDFDALDGEPVHIFFMILAPRDATGEHLKALARISRLVRDKFFRSSLLQCKTPTDVIRILKREEEKLE